MAEPQKTRNSIAATKSLIADAESIMSASPEQKQSRLNAIQRQRNCEKGFEFDTAIERASMQPQNRPSSMPKVSCLRS